MAETKLIRILKKIKKEVEEHSLTNVVFYTPSFRVFIDTCNDNSDDGKRDCENIKKFFSQFMNTKFVDWDTFNAKYESLLNNGLDEQGPSIESPVPPSAQQIDSSQQMDFEGISTTLTKIEEKMKILKDIIRSLQIESKGKISYDVVKDLFDQVQFRYNYEDTKVYQGVLSRFKIALKGKKEVIIKNREDFAQLASIHSEAKMLLDIIDKQIEDGREVVEQVVKIEKTNKKSNLKIATVFDFFSGILSSIKNFFNGVANIYKKKDDIYKKIESFIEKLSSIDKSSSLKVYSSDAIDNTVISKEVVNVLANIYDLNAEIRRQNLFGKEFVDEVKKLKAEIAKSLNDLRKQVEEINQQFKNMVGNDDHDNVIFIVGNSDKFNLFLYVRGYNYQSFLSKLTDILRNYKGMDSIFNLLINATGDFSISINEVKRAKGTGVYDPFIEFDKFDRSSLNVFAPNENVITNFIYELQDNNKLYFGQNSDEIKSKMIRFLNVIATLTTNSNDKKFKMTEYFSNVKPFIQLLKNDVLNKDLDIISRLFIDSVIYTLLLPKLEEFHGDKDASENDFDKTLRQLYDSLRGLFGSSTIYKTKLVGYNIDAVKNNITKMVDKVKSGIADIPISEVDKYLKMIDSTENTLNMINVVMPLQHGKEWGKNDIFVRPGADGNEELQKFKKLAKEMLDSLKNTFNAIKIFYNYRKNESSKVESSLRIKIASKILGSEYFSNLDKSENTLELVNTEFGDKLVLSKKKDKDTKKVFSFNDVVAVKGYPMKGRIISSLDDSIFMVQLDNGSFIDANAQDLTLEDRNG